MNPFAQYSAKSLVHVPAKRDSSGWIHTKKRGRDDEEISRDQARVIEARQKARAAVRAVKASTSNKKQIKGKGKSSKKKYQSYSDSEDDEDDDESLGDFIVDDEEDIEEYESTEESCTEKKQNLKKNSKSMESLRALPRTKAAVLELTSSTSTSSSADSSPDVDHLKPSHKTTRAPHDTDSEAEFLLNDKKAVLTVKDRKGNKSKAHTSAKDLFMDDSDSDHDSTLNHIRSKRTTEYSTTQASKKKPNIFSDDFEDDDPIVDKLPTSVRSSTWNEDDFADDDEAVAMVYAMEESLKTCRKDQKKAGLKRLGSNKVEKSHKPKPLTKSGVKQDTRESDVPRYDESSTESDEDVCDVDEYKDEADNGIQVILKAVDVLSSRIISRMVRGAISTDSIRSEIMPGLIVDGALALSTLDKLPMETSSENELQAHSASDQWISQEDIVTVCPNLKLADYQLIGVNWLWLLYGMTCDLSSVGLRYRKEAQVNGVLADEMGLGKTIQTIAFLAWLKKQSPTSDPHLIIVPASVLANWEREIHLFCPQMVVVKYHGSVDERAEIKDHLRMLVKKDKFGEREAALDVVLTTFSYFSSEKSDDRSFLKKMKWNYMIVDEAHCLKNQNGARYKNMDNVNTQRRLLLTGTPIQNHPAELVALLCFLMPVFADAGSRGPAETDDNSKDCAMIEYFRSLESNAKGCKSNADSTSMIQQLKQLLAPFILRRKKDDVMSQLIPPKTKKVEFVPFDQCVQQTYEGILTSHINSKSKGGVTNIEDLTFQKHLFTSLRKAANHPLLLRTRFTASADIAHLSKHLHSYGYFGYHETCTVQLVEKELENYSDYDIHCAALTLIEQKPLRREELGRYILDDDTLFLSPKFQRLKCLLPTLIAEGHRILIFSQWTRCLDLLESLMDSLDILYLRLDGQTSISDRQGLIDKFNNDSSIPVFLLSTRAGGMGINLTSADTCILHDLDFNPFNDLQAEDRCHRIGQTKPVTVIKMITKGTVDEDIYHMQERKTSMNAAILESSKKNSSKSEDDDMKNVLKAAVNRYLHKDESEALDGL